MSRVLLDTHAFLWFVFDDARLSGPAERLMSDASVEKLMSIASLWEIVIKQQVGKLALGRDVETFLRREVMGRELELVALEVPHLLEYARLPLTHRDPFDRLLVAQAIVLDVPIVTSDPNFARYGVKTIW